MSKAAPRWHRRPEARRDELLDAATGLLQQRPLDEIKVIDITRSAGTSKGTFYTYFDTKEHLYTALNERYVDGLMAVMETARQEAGSGNFFDQIDASLAAIIAYMFENDDLIEVWEREGIDCDGDEAFLRGTNRIVSELAVEIGEQAATGTVQCDDPMATALLIVHAIDGAVGHDMTGRTGDTPLGPERITRVAQKMFRAMLA